MSELSKVNSNIAINMGKRCVAAGCSNTNGDGVSLFRFPRDPALRAQWNKQVQRTRADWKGATEYSVLCSEHFTSKCFEEDSFIAAQFGLTKRKRLKPDAVPSVFHRTTAATETHGHSEEGPSIGHKRVALAEEETIPHKKRKAAFEKRERARVW